MGDQAVPFPIQHGQRLTISRFNTVSSAASCPVTASRRASSSRSSSAGRAPPHGASPADL
jgi:hypothetical protein